jgi:hypothetical protein
MRRRSPRRSTGSCRCFDREIRAGTRNATSRVLSRAGSMRRFPPPRSTFMTASTAPRRMPSPLATTLVSWPRSGGRTDTPASSRSCRNASLVLASLQLLGDLGVHTFRNDAVVYEIVCALERTCGDDLCGAPETNTPQNYEFGLRRCVDVDDALHRRIIQGSRRPSVQNETAQILFGDGRGGQSLGWNFPSRTPSNFLHSEVARDDSS